ncbi:Uncharacterized protein QTN25_000887 [Entamoeba marina]
MASIITQDQMKPFLFYKSFIIISLFFHVQTTPLLYQQPTNDIDRLRQAISQCETDYTHYDFIGDSFDSIHKQANPYKTTEPNFQGDGQDLCVKKMK